MARIRVDGAVYEVDSSQNLLQACLNQGLDLPYFCWHPALGSVGACRQCAVKQYKDENDTEGKIVMACMTPAADGTIISIDDEDARAFRRSVIEWLMVNHPHDCPVCDEGGECHLQDMTVMTGHNYRRFRFNKRTYRNQDLGPFINHEMNRCIQCYRCVRYYQDYAGGTDLVALAAHDHVYFGRHTDGTLESPFSGNLVEICPTGVFTDKSQKKHYTRKWDLSTAPSVCVHCSLGCNTTPGERYGSLRRIRNRYNGAVNGYFLCDRGRYGYEFVNAETRILRPLRPQGPERPAEPLERDAALERFASLLRDGKRLVGIGSPRASLESNFALRTLVGEDRFFHGVSAGEHRLAGMALDILRDGRARTPSLRELERADAVLVLGEDVSRTAPVASLALRQSVRGSDRELAEQAKVPLWNDLAVREVAQHRHGPLYVAATGETGLDDIATHVFRGAPEDIARLGFAVARALDPEAPPVPDLAEDMSLLAQDLAQILRDAERPAVVTGTGQGSEAVLAAAADAAWALGRFRERAADLFIVLPECNSLGLAMLGGAGLEDEAVRTVGSEDTVIVLENDLYRRGPAGFVDGLLAAAGNVVVLDHTAHETAARAALALPAATFAEADGTLVNNEGRAQRFFRVFAPGNPEVAESWRWLLDAADAAGRDGMRAWRSLDDVLRAMADAVPLLKGAIEAAPGADYREAGAPVPRLPFRYSGRTAMHADRTMHEPRPPADPDSPLVFTMEGYPGRPPAALNPRVWAPGWNSVQALNRFQEEIAGAMKGGDPGVRLLEPSAEGRAYFTDVPAAFAPRRDRFRAVGRHHVFGSDELSMRADGVAQRAPEPYLALNPEDAATLGLAENDPVTAGFEDGDRTLPLRLDGTLPRGIVAVPRGLPRMPDAGRAEWIHLRKGNAS